MSTLEKLAIEHGATLIEEDTGQWDGMPMYVGEIVFHNKAQLEAFAKALQSSEPVGYTSRGYIDGVKNSIGDLGNFAGNFFKNKWQNVKIPLYTHPPASVSLEKYNKLLDALKDAHNAMPFSFTKERVAKLIAEAEAKEG